MKKKTSTGERIASVQDFAWAYPQESANRLKTKLARRIDGAIAAERRKERERCFDVMMRADLTMQQRLWAIKEGR